MSENDAIIQFVEANMLLEGMTLSADEKLTLSKCLTGKTTFSDALQRALVKHTKKPVLA